MASAVIFGNRKLAYILAKRASKGLPAVVPTRAGGYWNYQWKPGPYPTTEAERIAAAKKYNLIPEDYRPCNPDGEESTGDYPDLPIYSEAARDPYENYDFPVHKRNLGEPRFVYLASILSFYWIITSIGPVCAPPTLAKQYPNDGAKHYTYEKP